MSVRLSNILGVSLTVGLALVGACSRGAGDNSSAQAVASVANPYASIVSNTGDISFPKDFPNGMVFMGSWAVTGENGVADIHSVYGRQVDIDYYKENGVFPDGAVLIKEVVEAEGAKHTTGDAFWGAKPVTWFLMVKDMQGRFPQHPLWGDSWGWAQFDPQDRSRQIASSYDESCKACHVPAADIDRVYVYAYAALGTRAQASVPADARSGRLTAGQQGHRNSESAAGKEESAAGPDVSMGKIAFEQQCSYCHSVEPGKHNTGPSLFAVVGRAAGAETGYDYSDAMRQANIDWSMENLDKFLADPKGFIPDNRMGRLFGGVSDAKARADIVAYLATVK